MEEGLTVEIMTPPGTVAGQELQVTVEGRQMNFVVPEGVREGEKLQLWFDPTAGTLWPLV